MCGCIGGWGHCPPDKDQTAAEIENSGSDGVGWVVEVNVRFTSDQELTSKQVAMLQKSASSHRKMICEDSFFFFSERGSIHTEEVDRMRGSEKEFGELKRRVFKRKRRCDNCFVPWHCCAARMPHPLPA